MLNIVHYTDKHDLIKSSNDGKKIIPSIGYFQLESFLWCFGRREVGRKSSQLKRMHLFKDSLIRIKYPLTLNDFHNTKAEITLSYRNPALKVSMGMLEILSGFPNFSSASVSVNRNKLSE